jgi:hypothetical protein
MSPYLKFLLPPVWLALVGAGFGYAWRYESTAGTPATKSHAPTDGAVPIAKSTPTVYFFAHPLCPCTKVGLIQLGSTMGRRTGAARLYVVLVRAEGVTSEEARSGLATEARKIAGAVVIDDPSGRIAKSFGASTSGQVLVFNAKGKPLFRGGVTDGRGHYGPNDGLEALAAILDGKTSKIHNTPVYGCSLLGETASESTR